MNRILYLQGSAERAGAETILLNLLRYLDNTEFEPTVLFLDEGSFIDEVASSGISVIRGPRVGRIRQPSSFPKAKAAILKAVSDTGAQLIHANGERMSVYAGIAGKTARLPTIAWLHDAPGAGGLTGWATQALLRITPQTSVVTCARWLAQRFNATLGFKATAVQNGLDLAKMPDSSEAMAILKREAGWEPDAPVLAFFGRFQTWKGPHVFIEAAALLRQSCPTLRFVMVGGAMFGREVALEQELRSKAAALGLDGALVFTGYRKDAIELMLGSDIVAHCSIKADPFPTVILEAQILGKPIIATRTGGAEEAIEHAKTGLLVNPGVVSELVEHLERLIRDPDMRADLGAAAREHGRRLWDARRMATEFEELYSRLLA